MRRWGAVLHKCPRLWSACSTVLQMWEILRAHRATSLCILSCKSTERTDARSCRACRCTRTCRRLRSDAIPAASCCPLLLRSITRIKHRETKYNFRCATRPSDRVRRDRSVYARGTEKPVQSPCSTLRKSGCCTRPPRTPRPMDSGARCWANRRIHRTRSSTPPSTQASSFCVGAAEGLPGSERSKPDLQPPDAGARAE